MAHDHTPEQPRIDQLANADTGRRGVVGDDREVAPLLAHEFVHQRLGRADAHKAADHQGGPCGDHRDSILKANGLHCGPPQRNRLSRMCD